MSGVEAAERQGLLSDYDPEGFYCELLGMGGAGLPHTDVLRQRIDRQRLKELQRRAADTERELYNLGITFTVYSQKDAIDRILPFDIIPTGDRRRRMGRLSRKDWCSA